MNRDSLPLETIKTCADLCAAAYAYPGKTQATIDELNTEYGISAEKLRWFDVKSTDTQAIVTSVGRTAYLAFQGTTNVVDWFNNLTVDLVGYKSGNWHSGFSRVATQTYKEIGGYVKQLLTSGECDDLVITGHSLGGALAMVYSEMLLAENSSLKLKGLVTFGQPRVGNKLFLEEFLNRKISYQRFVNENDVVPDVPPPLGMSDWHHSAGIVMTGTTISLDSGKYDSNALGRAISILISKFWSLIRKTQTQEEIVNSILQYHAMDSYLHNLRYHFPEIAKRKTPPAPDLLT